MTKDVFIKEVRDAEAMLYHISKSILIVGMLCRKQFLRHMRNFPP